MSYKKVLVKNDKMKATEIAHPELRIRCVSMPPGRTCPMKDKCEPGCYACFGRMGMPNFIRACNENFEMVKDGSFWFKVECELAYEERLAAKKGKQLCIRIHDAGDFFSREYLLNWLNVMEHHPDVRFYAYTKSVSLLKSVTLPKNFTVIFSYGGKEDELIEPTDRHAHVVQKWIPWEYTDGSKDEIHAMNPEETKIALIYHGPLAHSYSTLSKD
jgi:hypothetical protein